MTGFNDAHCHALFAGRELQGAILHDCKNADELVKTIRKHIAENPQKVWFDLSAVKANFPIDRFTLDQASTEIPIVVHTDDHHSICVNSRALEVAGLSDQAPDVSGGRFDKAAGKPNGWIHEYVAMQLIYAHQPKPTLDEDLVALAQAQEVLLGYEVNAMTEAWIDEGMPDVYLAAAERGQLLIKTDLAIRITPETPNLDFALKTRDRVNMLNHPMLSANTVKLFLDGVFSSNTAWLKSHPDSEGVWQSELLLKVAQQAVEAGFNLHFHACGDAAVKQAIDVVKQTQAQNSVIAHADLVDPADLPALRDLAITVNSTPVWAKDSPADHFNYRALLDAGVKLTFGSDWPVSPPDAKANMAAAIMYRNLTAAEAQKAAGYFQ